MDGLHRCDNGESGEARNVVWVQVLGVLDSPAEVFPFGLGFEARFKNVQDFAVGSITDRVDTELKVMLDSDFGGFDL